MAGQQGRSGITLRREGGKFWPESGSVWRNGSQCRQIRQPQTSENQYDKPSRQLLRQIKGRAWRKEEQREEEESLKHFQRREPTNQPEAGSDPNLHVC